MRRSVIVALVSVIVIILWVPLAAFLGNYRAQRIIDSLPPRGATLSQVSTILSREGFRKQIRGGLLSTPFYRDQLAIVVQDLPDGLFSSHATVVRIQFHDNKRGRAWIY